MDNEKIGKFIKQLRTDNQYSQGDVAKICSVSNQAVSKWEKGDSIPDISTLDKLSTLYRVSINDIIRGEVTKNQNKTNIINIVLASLYTLLLFTYVLPFIQVGDYVFSGYDVFVGNMDFGTETGVAILFLLYFVQFVMSLVMVFSNEFKASLYRYVSILLSVIGIFYVVTIFNYSHAVESTRLFIIMIYAITFMLSLVDLVSGLKTKKYEKDTIKVRKLIVYFTLVPYSILALVFVYQFFQDTMYVDLPSIIMVTMLIVYVMMGIFMTKRIFESRLLINVYLMAAPIGLFITFITAMIVYSNGKVDEIFYLILAIMFVPFILVNTDWITMFIKRVTAKEVN